MTALLDLYARVAAQKEPGSKSEDGNAILLMEVVFGRSGIGCRIYRAT
jgi:hypothetical protein